MLAFGKSGDVSHARPRLGKAKEKSLERPKSRSDLNFGGAAASPDPLALRAPLPRGLVTLLLAWRLTTVPRRTMDTTELLLRSLDIF